MMKLNDTTRPKIALILIREDFDTHDVMSLMVEYYTLGQEPDHQSLYPIIWGIKDHLKKRVLKSERYDGTSYNKFGIDMDKLVMEFFNEIIEPWIRTTYPKLWWWLKTQNNDYSMEHVCSYKEWVDTCSEMAMSEIEGLEDMMWWGQEID